VLKAPIQPALKEYRQKTERPHWTSHRHLQILPTESHLTTRPMTTSPWRHVQPAW